jgi:hypothetical protein
MRGREEQREQEEALWRDAAMRAEVRAQAAAGGLRAELAERLIDFDGIVSTTPEKMRLAVEGVLGEAEEVP